MVIKKIVRHETFIVIGIAMVLVTLSKLVGIIDISSDWFWFLAGMALVFEGCVHLKKELNFKKKYKVLKKEEYEKLKKVT